MATDLGAQYAQIAAQLPPGSALQQQFLAASKNPSAYNPAALQQNLVSGASYSPAMAGGNIPGANAPLSDRLIPQMAPITSAVQQDPGLLQTPVQQMFANQTGGTPLPSGTPFGGGGFQPAPQPSTPAPNLPPGTPGPSPTPINDSPPLGPGTPGPAPTPMTTIGGQSNGPGDFRPTTALTPAQQQQFQQWLSQNYPGAANQSPSSFSPININNPALQTEFPAPNTPIGGGYSIAPPGDPQFNYWWNNGNPYTGGDPGRMASSEANRAIDYGNQFEHDYGNQFRQALGQQNAYQNQADLAYNDLARIPGYTGQEAQAIQANPYSVLGVVGDTQARMDAAIDPTKLGLSDQYVQQLKDQAAQQIGLQYGAAQDQLQRQADASGTVNPLALSAARNQLLRSQAINSADAFTNADIAATGAQRQANTNIANMRLGAATTLGGMGLQANQFADTSASNRAANIAQQRIQGQQAARNYWQSQGQFLGNQANAATQGRLAGAQTSLSGMGQGGSLAAGTEQERRAFGPRLGLNWGGVSISTGI